MRRYVRLIRIFVKNSVQLELEYRLNFVFNIINSAVSFGAGFIVLFVMFANAENIGGWSFTETLVLYGVFLMMEAFIDVLMYPNLNRIPEYIRTGNMDFFLLKPVSAQFLASFRYARVWRLPEGLLGFGVVLFGMARLGELNAFNVTMTLLLTLSAFAMIYAIWFALTTTAFWFVKVENISELFFAFFTAGRFPVAAFPAWARFFLTFIVPIAFITTVPASAAVGRFTPQFAFGSLIIALILLLGSHLIWRYAVANYTSASS